MLDPVQRPSDAVITGLGPMCPWARDAAELKAGPATPSDGLPCDRDWFDAAGMLGPKGFKYFTPPTRYLLAACSQAFRDAALGDQVYQAEDKGVFIGTNFAAHGTLEAMDRTILSEGAAALQPMHAPNFSVNLPASQVSIKYHCEAFNVSLTSAMVAGLQSVVLAESALRKGRARLVVAGATEDQAPGGAARLLELQEVRGAACALVLESSEAARRRGARIYARVAGSYCGFFDPRSTDLAATLRKEMAGALERLVGTAARTLPYASLSSSCSFMRMLDHVTRSSAIELGADPVSIRVQGDSGLLATVSPVLQLATLAAIHGSGLVVASSPQGHVMLVALEKTQ